MVNVTIVQIISMNAVSVTEKVLFTQLVIVMEMYKMNAESVMETVYLLDIVIVTEAS